MYVKETINDIKGTIILKKQEDPEGEGTFAEELSDIRKKLVEDWIEKKIIQLADETEESQPIKSKKTPSKVNERIGKPELTELQIAILFKVFKEKHIFTNKYLDKKPYSEIISQLTGYSQHSLRQDFSAKQLTDLSAKAIDYEKIIAKLIEVIEELKKSINQINKK